MNCMLFLRREQDNNLWVQALAYFARKEENCKTQIMEVLSHIDRRNLLPPLLVIQTLAHNSTATLAVVKVRRVKIHRVRLQRTSSDSAQFFCRNISVIDINATTSNCLQGYKEQFLLRFFVFVSRIILQDYITQLLILLDKTMVICRTTLHDGYSRRTIR